VWPLTPERAPLNPDAIRVWAWRVDDVSRYDLACRDLTPEEKARADRFYFERDRLRFTLAHSGLRRLLGAMVGREPAELRFGAMTHGKPVLCDLDLEFNLSHSGDYAMLAVSTQRVGVDIELHRHHADRIHLARRVFAPAEFEQFSAASGSERKTVFYRGWTLKEAFIKAHGRGLGFGLKRFWMDLSPVRERLVRFGRDSDESQWTAYTLDAPTGYSAAVCAPGRDHCIEQVTW